MSSIGTLKAWWPVALTSLVFLIGCDSGPKNTNLKPSPPDPRIKQAGSQGPEISVPKTQDPSQMAK